MTLNNTVNLITDLERRYLECSICTELFNEDERLPRVLPCNHSFCSKCLKKLGHRKDTIKCPTCNHVHNVKKNYPFHFAKDNTIRDLKSFLHSYSDLNAFKKCCQCGHTVDVTYNCHQCKINLCGICRQQHEKENITHNLIVNKFETSLNWDVNFDICLNPQHERAKLKHFCRASNCQSVLCPSCVIDEHRDANKHELEDIEEAFKKRKKELENDIKYLRTQIAYVKSTKQNIQDNINAHQDNKDEFLRKIDAVYTRGINVLENRRQKLKDLYTVAFNETELESVTQKDKLDSFLRNASPCCNLSEQLINGNNMRSFLNVHQTVDTHLKQCLNTPIEDSTIDDFEEKKVYFDNYLRLFQTKIENLENDETNESIDSLEEMVNENNQTSFFTNTISTIGNHVGMMFRYLNQNVKQTVSYVVAFICMITRYPLMLIQLLIINPMNAENANVIQPGEEQLNERRVEQMFQDVRQIDRGQLRQTEHDNGRLEQIHGYVKGFRDAIGHIILLLMIILVVREIILIPLRIKEFDNPIGLTFNTEADSQFVCRSVDNKSVSTKPLNNMSCGSTGRLFKFEGVFANTPFLFGKDSSIEFSVRFKKANVPPRINENKTFELLIFEFGLVEGTISRKLLHPSHFSVSAFDCQNIVGVCLITGNGLPLKSEAILKSETNSSFIKGQFLISYQSKVSTFFILAKSAKGNTMIDVYRAQLVEFETPIWPVFAAYNSDVITVLITIETNKIGFDRHTLHPNLFISDENKTISNTMLGGTYPSNNTGNPLIFTHPKKFENSSTIQTIINIDFVDSNGGTILFNIGLREYKHGKFEGTKLLECTKCEVKYFFGFFRTTGYCFSDDSGLNQIVVGNQIGLLLQFNKNGLVEVYVFNNFLGYSYCFFKLEPFHDISPEFYIEKVNARDMAISSSDNSKNKHNDYL